MPRPVNPVARPRFMYSPSGHFRALFDLSFSLRTYSVSSPDTCDGHVYTVEGLDFPALGILLLIGDWLFPKPE